MVVPLDARIPREVIRDKSGVFCCPESRDLHPSSQKASLISIAHKLRLPERVRPTQRILDDRFLAFIVIIVLLSIDPRQNRICRLPLCRHC